jgi:spore coat polysaccharide biosynthesis protein SpsF
LNTHIYIQARINSTRLPGKILKKICGMTILEIILERLKKVEKIDKIILVTGPKKQNSELIKEADRLNLEYFCGNEENILDRFYLAAQKFNSNVIIRITADCPLIDFELINHGLNIFLENKYELLCNNIPRTFPHGLDFEIFKKKHLTEMWNIKKDEFQNDELFLNTFINPIDDIFKNLSDKTYCLTNKMDLSSIRVTLDYEEDFEVIKTIFEYYNDKNPFFGLSDLIFLKKILPNIFELNRKY